MTFNQQIFLEHEHGATVQWQSEDWSWSAIALYHQIELEGTNIDKEVVKYKQWVLGSCTGPWTGYEDGKLVFNGQYEQQRDNICGEANLILTCLNGTINGREALKSIWRGFYINTKDKE